MCCLEGKGVDQDTELAVSLLHIPANKGSSIAQVVLLPQYSYFFTSKFILVYQY